MERFTAATYRDLSPQELWQRFKAGDERALGELAREHYPGLYNYGLRLTTDSELVWDTIQDLFLELWDHRETVGNAVFVKTYLLKALRYKLLKSRAHQSPIQIDDSDKSGPFSVSIEDEIIDQEVHTEQARLLHQLMASLTKRQQEVLYLRFYQNLDNHEIAQIMGMERQSVANLLHRTFKELRSHWSPDLLLSLLLLILPKR
ncbi:RNA polymerase sigma factor [Spirosoma endbachense]|uniref:Sigma-70 family RNA polymerase sigma factor n=1 Tax=Spirosoma endbachense TaxID=2666025 RepID=A0A6P1VX50_9BACT|nr:sigma-70 family RNA polymerase sigma factor [Spirosoma endbachense]QHV96367.1 sigma-70 family RNA polymerase sigma factor [Spirosoma endbachense]